MLGERLLNAGGGQLVGKLAIACAVLLALLLISAVLHVLQFRGSARLASECAAKLAATEATGRAEILHCADINQRADAVATRLANEITACRGAQQDLERQLARAVDQQELARQRLREAAREAEESIRRTYERDPECRAWGLAPVCRARSDGMLGAAPHDQAE